MSIGQSIIVRDSEIKDAPGLMALDELVWNERTAPASLSWKTRGEFLRHTPPGTQLVAVQDETLCGYIGFRPPTLLASNSHVLEINIAVHPRYQRQGIGSALMNALLEQTAQRGVKKISLRVLSSNISALTFYQKCGFVEEGRLFGEFYIEGQYVDDILMAYYLDGIYSRISWQEGS